MKSFILGSFILLFSVSSFAGSLRCSNSDGLLQLSSESYSGGAAPPPGMLLQQRQWLFRGETVFLESSYMDCHDNQFCGEDRPEEFISNIDWVEQQESKQVLQQQGRPHDYFSRTVYAVKISLFSKNPGQVMTGMEQEKREDWYICDETKTFYP